jgi:hypothetical protein
LQQARHIVLRRGRSSLWTAAHTCQVRGGVKVITATYAADCSFCVRFPHYLVDERRPI